MVGYCLHNRNSIGVVNVRIKIIRCKGGTAWYKDYIGEEFEVVGTNILDMKKHHSVKVDGKVGFFVDFKDAEVVEE